MSGLPILSSIIFLPILGLIFMLSSKGDNIELKNKNSFNVAILTIIFEFILLIRLFTEFDFSKDELQLVENYDWLSFININLTLGIDNISFIISLLISAITIIALFACNKEKDNHMKYNLALLLMGQSSFLGLVFAADIFTFYIFFEIGLIPLFLLIGCSENENSIIAATKLFLYNFFGSFIFLATIILIFIITEDTEFTKINFSDTPNHYKLYIVIGLILTILSKIPLIPFHNYQARIYNGLKLKFKIITSSSLPIIGVYSFIRLMGGLSLNSPEINLILSILTILSILYITFRYQNIFLFYVFNLGLFLTYMLFVSYYKMLDIKIFLLMMLLNILPNLYLLLKKEEK